jgi:hypothetical protein
MFTQKFETKLNYAPEFELYIPEQNNPKRLYRARYELLGRPMEFPTRTPDFKTAAERTLRGIRWEYIKATNPSPPDGASAEEVEDRAQDIFDRELGRAFGRVRSRSELELLQDILDAMVHGHLRTHESTEAFLKAKAYWDEKEAVDRKRRDELRTDS